MFLRIIGPSPALHMAKKIRSKILIRGGNEHLRQDLRNKEHYTDGEFFDHLNQGSERTGSTVFKSTESDIPRMTNQELNKKLADEAKKKIHYRSEIGKLCSRESKRIKNCYTS